MFPVLAVCTSMHARLPTSLAELLQSLGSRPPHQMHLRSVTTSGRRVFHIYFVDPGEAISASSSSFVHRDNSPAGPARHSHRLHMTLSRVIVDRA
jgi:hypothetical protein